ncbi:MAG: alpha/beta fold hydrolase [Acidimicrobiia bacterium]|nr:alpha/beta fold hydrolase [Acidimicrobiia bacterium]
MTVSKPPLINALVDPVRASGELATSVGLMPFLRLLPKGDGHAVLVLPGFVASDTSTFPLRTFLKSKGYAVSGWELGRNLGPTSEVMEGLPALLRKIFDEEGRKVSIVGWSMGGIYARWLARNHPEIVRQIITMGTPVRPAVENTSNVSTLFDYLRPYHEEDHPGLDNGAPLDVPTTAIHTRSDAIVPWETCLIDPGAQSENVRVSGSHSGLGFNPAALYVVADRLALEEDMWLPLTVRRWARSVVTVV